MKSVFTSAVIAITILLAACGDNPTNIDTSTGEIYGYGKIYDEYGELLTDQSGLTAQLMEEDKILQSTTTAADGLFSFKDVPASVYTIRFFKPGYSRYYNTPDTLVSSNIQFVGHGRFGVNSLINLTGSIQFYSNAEPDSSYWAIKPDIRYEVLKDIKEIKDILIRVDTLGYDTISQGHYKPRLKNVYGNGTVEKRKIHFTIEYERPLRNVKSQRTALFFIKPDNSKPVQHNATTEGNVLSFEYEYQCPNTVYRDSLGVIKDYLSYDYYSNISVKQISIQATCAIPNGVKQSQAPQRVAKSKELIVNLLD